jgi:hypothetical protein
MEDVRRRMTVRFDATLREWLDDIAQESGIVHDDGRPRDAELIRVLLVSGALGPETPVPARLLAALYCNGVLALSGSLSASVRGLRGSLIRLSATLAGGGRNRAVIDFLAEEPPLGLVQGVGTDRARVHLILDDRLHRAMSAMFAMSGIRTSKRRSPGAIVVDRVLSDVHARYEVHRPVVMGYGTAVRRMKDTIRAAVDAERDAIMAAIRGD